MIPIYEQGKGNGIGLSTSSFSERFEKLCAEHLQTKRAKAFAFIFYDFEDVDLRRVCKARPAFR
jgi:hypothetical protein